MKRLEFSIAILLVCLICASSARAEIRDLNWRAADTIAIGVTQAPRPFVEVVSITSPVSPGYDAWLVARTEPYAACSICVRYLSGCGHAQGLYDQYADSRGYLYWTWRVGTRTTPGTWPVIITCGCQGGPGATWTPFEVR